MYIGMPKLSFTDFGVFFVVVLIVGQYLFLSVVVVISLFT